LEKKWIENYVAFHEGTPAPLSTSTPYYCSLSVSVDTVSHFET